MLLVIDNYDSFTYNLVQYFGALGVEQRVFRNDKITTQEARDLEPERLLISPGPCTPNEAGISIPLINEFAGDIPILGVCLGHQSIAQHFGASIVRADQLMHGKTSTVHNNGDQLFEGLPSAFQVARYHSLIVDPSTIPENLKVIATSEQNEIMACRYADLPIWGVQFHPESVATENGMAILENFLKA